MRIVVCLKPVLDPEVPSQALRVDEQSMRLVTVGVPAATVMDSYAESALETALQLRDSLGTGRVTALCVGDGGADDVLRRALALTADDAHRVWDPAWAELDGLAVAHLLARAVEALGGADLILCGRQAADVEEGLVGPALASELGIPWVTMGRAIEPHDGRLRVHREADGLLLTVETRPPLVVTITSSESNTPRMPKVKDTMLARRKPIQVLGPDRLRPDPHRSTAGVRLHGLSLPSVESACEMLEGAGEGVATATLMRRLQELKVL